MTNNPEFDQNDIFWIQLARSENVGPITFQKLLSLYGTPRKALNHLHDLAKKGGAKRPIKVASLESVYQEIETAKSLGAHFIRWDHPAYSTLLRQVETAPPFLWGLGNLDLLQNPSCAVVGSRNASAGGQRIAAGIAQRLGRCHYTTVSGLARGIDTVVHHNTLISGTIAVLAGGIDQVYPPENKALYDKIADGFGLVLSEMPFGHEPHARLFPRRNRIISGLSLGVVVVEASMKSGSLVTAKYALEQGRDIFSVPGSPFDPRCEGTNRLIKEGATLVQTSQDVVDGLITLTKHLKEHDASYMTPWDRPAISDSLDITDSHRQRLRNLLSPTPVDVDVLVQYLGLSASAVLSLLLELELAGHLQRHTGGKVSYLENISAGSEDLF